MTRYLVTEGSANMVEPTVGGDAYVRTLLLGSTLDACLQQRNILILHASAIELDTGAVRFTGVAGSGGPNLLAALIRSGDAIPVDDVTGIVLDTGSPPIRRIRRSRIDV